jgi:hypothetical protein
LKGEGTAQLHGRDAHTRGQSTIDNPFAKFSGEFGQNRTTRDRANEIIANGHSPGCNHMPKDQTCQTPTAEKSGPATIYLSNPADHTQIRDQCCHHIQQDNLPIQFGKMVAKERLQNFSL